LLEKEKLALFNRPQSQACLKKINFFDWEKSESHPTLADQFSPQDRFGAFKNLEHKIKL
jgi:hypothetical protein